MEVVVPVGELHPCVASKALRAADDDLPAEWAIDELVGYGAVLGSVQVARSRHGEVR